ncbi:hypothetical protein NCS52_01545800 [Fusarium sp. LHS14.1]|nr:hypothetical protein NCS52_01545800 [Fusarium sp. LHS14.1]
MEREIQGRTERSAKDKRIMATRGISVRPDGSQNDLIHIKDICEIDFTSHESAEEIIVKGEEVVKTLTDFEKFMLAEDEHNTPKNLYNGLMQLKKKQLKTMAKGLELLVDGNDYDIVRQLMNRCTDGTAAGA